MYNVRGIFKYLLANCTLIRNDYEKHKKKDNGAQKLYILHGCISIAII